MLLTNSEIMDINQNAEFDSAIGYARAIESAVLAKLKAQEPICYHYTVDCCGVPEDMFGHPDGYYPEDAVPLYAHPDPRVTELEAVLRECRESLDAVKKWNAPPDFNGRKIDRIVEKAIAKINEVLK